MIDADVMYYFTTILPQMIAIDVNNTTVVFRKIMDIATRESLSQVLSLQRQLELEQDKERLGLIKEFLTNIKHIPTKPYLRNEEELVMFFKPLCDLFEPIFARKDELVPLFTLTPLEPEIEPEEAIKKIYVPDIVKTELLQEIFKNLNLKNPDWRILIHAHLLAIVPVKEFVYSFDYYENFQKFYNETLTNLIFNTDFFKYIYQCSFYPRDSMPALIQSYYYALGIMDRLKEMWFEITPLKIDFSPSLPTMYFDCYPETVQTVFQVVDYSNSFGQRYNLQWEWSDYNSWLFELNHKNVNPWKRLNSWVVQPRRVSNLYTEHLYPVISMFDNYDFEYFLDNPDKKINAKMKFKSFRKHIYLLNNGVSEIYLKHRDYVQGPSVAINNWWWNNFKSNYDLTSYRKQGLIFYWYEHFYSIEIPLKVLWANWYQSILPTWMYSFLGDGIVGSNLSWQAVLRPSHHVYKTWLWFNVTDTHHYSENGVPINKKSKEELRDIENKRTIWPDDLDLDFVDNSYVKAAEKKKYEEFLDLQSMVDTSKFVYKDPFSDIYVPGNHD